MLKELLTKSEHATLAHEPCARTRTIGITTRRVFRCWLLRFRLFVLLLACSCFFQEGFAQNKKNQIKIVGRVIAIDNYITVTSLPLSRDLIIKIVKRMEGDEQASYIKVVYQPLHGQKGLPKELWSSQSQWLFTLQRATEEDEICKEPVKGWIRTKPETDQAVPDFEKLPCYLLNPGEFKRHR